MSKYYPPEFGARQFHCIHCNVYAKQTWGPLERHYWGGGTMAVGGNTDFSWSKCEHCSEQCFWYEERMIVPSEAPVPPPHEDMPESCIEDYNEARDIVGRSPKAAAALMRLVVQKLMPELGQTGENINDDIAALVAQGLPKQIQQALDFCRVIGNNAVHPLEINLDDDPQLAHVLFEMVNAIVDNRITQPKRMADLYGKLPEGARSAIEKRDAS